MQESVLPKGAWRSVEDEPRFVVGMDAHARKLAVSVWDWTDRLNPFLALTLFAPHNISQILFCVHKFRRIQTTMTANQAR